MDFKHNFRQAFRAVGSSLKESFMNMSPTFRKVIVLAILSGLSAGGLISSELVTPAASVIGDVGNTGDKSP
jgi:type III secretory pathway component EscU